VKLKNLFIFLSLITVFLTTESIKAETVYCPTQIICDNGGICKINGDNGGQWTSYGSTDPGVYGFNYAEVSVIGGEEICYYSDIKGNIQDAAAIHNDYGGNFYYAIGLNWKERLGWGTKSCPPNDQWDRYDFTIPQACAFSTTPPSLKK
jgi:hypothetical protein